MNSLLKEITIFIPTRNRPVFLKRLLRYYQRVGFPGDIFVGDASDARWIGENRQICGEFGNHLNIRFFETPEVSTHQSIETMAAESRTRYATSVCDDDFLCLEGLADAAAFLEGNPDYVGAHGKGLIFGVDNPTPHGKICYSRSYPQAVIEEETPSERLQSYFKNGGAVVFSLYRTEDWKSMFQNPAKVSRYQITFIFGELVNASVAVLRGKIKELDSLYLLRQAHQGQKMAELDIYKWFVHPEWYPTYQFLADAVLKELRGKTEWSDEEGRKFFEEIFGAYLTRVLRKYLPLQFEKKGNSRSIARKISDRVSRYRSRLQGKDPLDLASLMTLTSRYAASFRPFYQIITGDSA